VTGVYVLPMRNPFVVAKAVGTAAVISENRLTLGIGMGWMEDGSLFTGWFVRVRSLLLMSG